MDDSPKEYQRAEAIFQRALLRPNLNDPRYVLERLKDLHSEWGKVEGQVVAAVQREQPEAESKPIPRRLATSLASPLAPSGRLPAMKLGRNDPCWCGSGKKYKRCHLQSDEKSRR